MFTGYSGGPRAVRDPESFRGAALYGDRQLVESRMAGGSAVGHGKRYYAGEAVREIGQVLRKQDGRDR